MFDNNSDYACIENFISNLLDAFIDTIDGKDEFTNLSDSALAFWNDYLKNTIDLSIVSPTELNLIFETKYNNILNNSFTTDTNHFLIKSFAAPMVTQYISYVEKHFSDESVSFEFPKELGNILILFSNRLGRDQILYKYTESGLLSGSDNMNSLKDDINKAKLTVSQLSEKAAKTRKRLGAFSKKLQNSEKKVYENNITILGIFASIVLVFNASVSFYAEAIKTFCNSNIYEMLFFFCLIGLIVLAALMGLIYYLETVRKSNNQKSRVVMPFIVVIIVLFLIMTYAWFAGGLYKNDTLSNEQKNTAVTENTSLPTQTNTDIEESTLESQSSSPSIPHVGT